MSDEETKHHMTDMAPGVAEILERLKTLEESTERWRNEDVAVSEKRRAEGLALRLEGIRDGFAAAALTGVLARAPKDRDVIGGCTAPSQYAQAAYRYADAMMRARKP